MLFSLQDEYFNRSVYNTTGGGRGTGRITGVCRTDIERSGGQGLLDSGGSMGAARQDGNRQVAFQNLGAASSGSPG